MKLNLAKDREFRKILALFLVMKIVVIAAGIFSQTLPVEITNRQARSDNILINPWAQYDAAAYVDIAENGYNKDFMDGRGNYAWFPLYPLLIRLFSFIGYWNAAFLISNAASLLAVIVLYLLAREELGKSQVSKTFFYMLLFPTSYFFTAMYTESLFLLLSAASFYFARENNWLHAAAAGFLLSLTRPQGIIILFPLVYMCLKANKIALSQHKLLDSIKSAKKEFAYLILVPSGILLLLLYHYVITGDPFVQLSTQKDFQRSFALPWNSVLNSISLFISTPGITGRFYHFFNIFTLSFFLVMLVKSYRLVKKEYFIYFLLSFLMPLFTLRLEAITRFYLVVFPAFMTMAVMSKDRRTKTALKVIYSVFFVLLVLFTIRHGNEGIMIASLV